MADLHAVTAVREAHVFKGGRRVATTLPLTDEPTLSPAGAVPPLGMLSSA